MVAEEKKYKVALYSLRFKARHQRFIENNRKNL